MIIKTDKELNILRENAKVHKIIFDEIKKFVKPGISGYDVNKLCGDLCKKYNVIPWFKWVYGFPGNICISVNDCVVHGAPSKRVVFKDGDAVKFDFWVKDKKIWINTDSAFTMIVGEGPHNKEIERFLKVAEEALYKWIKQAIPWNKTWDIWHAIQKHIEDNWFYVIKDLTGHWLGYTLHEKPYLPNYWKPGTGTVLKENMLLAIEPIVGFWSGRIVDEGGFEIYVEDWSVWAQFEHTILVKPVYPEIIV